MFAGYDSDGYNKIQTGRPECLFTSLYINNPFEREEVVQQVFIRLWEKRESIDESVDLDGYLFIITRNMIFNRSRRSFNEKAYKEAMEAIGSDSYTLDAPLVI